MSADGCCYCGTTKDLRPYGPRGAMLCFLCMKASPERERAAKGAFCALLDAAQTVGGGVATIDARTNEGPMPGLHLPEHGDAE